MTEFWRRQNFTQKTFMRLTLQIYSFTSKFSSGFSAPSKDLAELPEPVFIFLFRSLQYFLFEFIFWSRDRICFGVEPIIVASADLSRWRNEGFLLLESICLEAEKKSGHTRSTTATTTRTLMTLITTTTTTMSSTIWKPQKETERKWTSSIFASNTFFESPGIKPNLEN